MKKQVFRGLLSKVDRGCAVFTAVRTEKEVFNICNLKAAMRWLTRTFDDGVFA